MNTDTMDLTSDFHHTEFNLSLDAYSSALYEHTLKQFEEAQRDVQRRSHKRRLSSGTDPRPRNRPRTPPTLQSS
ncbi:hypothetical protein CTheo_6810 [Ceratobasidium theobromae]|uniref:Uncharacterized protein n=1 Tax=Ceratobasidium theobromae TaxID=1582974 RepID=A0A5N5QDD0_9AGAM|nr:hypothetical protein CTheo_6810 [Ceratobasidium theobromae]